MKRKNKGFTLVEILAVIVILALIATPIILNVINDAKKQAAKDSFYENGTAVTAVYYNPETGKKCDDYTEKNSTTGTKSGCMKWYVFNDKEGNATVNVILDHNTTAGVAYNSTGSNSEMKEVKKALENDTKDWKNTARLITANEVAKITGNTGFDASKENQDWFCLDTNQPDNTSYCAKAQGTSEYVWLFDYTNGCTSYGCNTSDSNTWGYWTNTPYKDNSIYAWHVGSSGHLGNSDVTISGRGIRPVITISKSNI
jgi:prepilin-type N-terminal cleavage/methylation domain-containing protein